jgi:hypothetical protein
VNPLLGIIHMNANKITPTTKQEIVVPMKAYAIIAPMFRKKNLFFNE